MLMAEKMTFLTTDLQKIKQHLGANLEGSKLLPDVRPVWSLLVDGFSAKSPVGCPGEH